MKLFNDLQVASCRMANVTLTEAGVVLIELNRVMPTTSKLLHLRNILVQLIDPNSKPPYIIDTSKALPFLREDRLLTDVCLLDISSQVAFVYSGDLSKMISKLFIELSDLAVPMDYFNTQESAYNWLKINKHDLVG